MTSLVPVIEIQISSFSTILSISNCDFYHIAWLQSTLEIMINPLISSKHNDAKIMFKIPLNLVNVENDSSTRQSTIECDSKWDRQALIRIAVH